MVIQKKNISGNESIERLPFDTEFWDWMQWERKILFLPYRLLGCFIFSSNMDLIDSKASSQGLKI